jgi:hypothetical protein
MRSRVEEQRRWAGGGCWGDAVLVCMEEMCADGPCMCDAVVCLGGIHHATSLALQVYRGKDGERLSRDAYVAQRDKERNKKKAQYEEQRELAWGGGLKQRQEAEAKAKAMVEEAAKPFARWDMRGAGWGDEFLAG